MEQRREGVGDDVPQMRERTWEGLFSSGATTNTGLPAELIPCRGERFPTIPVSRIVSSGYFEHRQLSHIPQ